MDVRCARCGTEYDFDDALISERGTTVKCTHCGHQFKIFPPGGQSSAPERWVVRTATGRELVYTSLRDLQRGIAKGQVGPDDMLSRGDLPARSLAGIAELGPFFTTQAPRAVPRTLHGVAPPANAPAPVVARAGRRAQERKAVPRPGGAAPTASSRHAGPLASPTHPQPAPSGTVLVPASASAQATPSQVTPSTARSETVVVAPPAREPAPPDEPSLPLSAPGSQPLHEGAPLEPPEVPGAAEPHRTEPSAQHAATVEVPSPSRPPEEAPSSSRERHHVHPPDAEMSQPWDDARRRFPSFDDLTNAQELGTGRFRQARWIVAAVMLGGLVVLALTVGRQYLTRFAKPPADQAEPVDARVRPLYESGVALLERGELEEAKEKLDKASVLAERDSAVGAALARLEVIRADFVWLKLRLLDPADEVAVQAAHRELAERTERAREAVDKAFARAPEQPDVVRARVDVLRLLGQPDKARSWIRPISDAASQPENAYVLAMLDLAERSPGLDSIVDRLSTAASGERALGRARAALIYVLARAGDIGRAESELSKLKGLNPRHPLLPELQSFVAKSAEAVDAGTDAKAKSAREAPAQPLDQPPVPGDFRARLLQADRALEQGELARAEELYENVLAAQPNNTEALAGLAEVLRRRKDPRAADLYDQVLDKNPSYLPALIARADSLWDAGERAQAVKLYRRIVDQAGAGSSYGRRAAERLAEAERSGDKGPPSSAPAKEKPLPGEATAPAAPEPPPESAPHIDTTDLPEYNQ